MSTKAILSEDQVSELMGLPSIQSISDFCIKHKLKWGGPTVENGGLKEEEGHTFITLKECFLKAEEN